MSVEDQLAANKAAGQLVERLVTQCVPSLRLVPDDVAQHYDAVATALVTPHAELPLVGICLLERGTVVEIKSVVRRTATGERGRFYFRAEQHRRLIEAAGVYCFAVCENAPERDLLRLKIVPATLVDELLPADPWLDGGSGRPDYAQLTWSRLFAPAEIDAGETPPVSGGGGT